MEDTTIPTTQTRDALMVDRLKYLCDTLTAARERRATLSLVWSSHGAASIITGSVEMVSPFGVTIRGMIMAPPQNNQLGTAFIPLVDIARITEPSGVDLVGLKG